MSFGLGSSIHFLNILLWLFSSVKDVFCIFLFITFFELKPLSLARKATQLSALNQPNWKWERASFLTLKIFLLKPHDSRSSQVLPTWTLKARFLVLLPFETLWKLRLLEQAVNLKLLAAHSQSHTSIILLPTQSYKNGSLKVHYNYGNYGKNSPRSL